MSLALIRKNRKLAYFETPKRAAQAAVEEA